MGEISDLQSGFGARLRRARQIAGLSQRRLAESLSIARTLVSHWETGKREPGLWESVRAARVLGVPVSELVIGTPGLPSGSQTVWQEMAYRGSPVLAAGDSPLWALRPLQDSVADALLHPEPRLIDRLPGLLLAEDFPPEAMWGVCAGYGVERRLGWTADIARTIAESGSIPSRPLTSRTLEKLIGLSARPSATARYDTLGFGADRTERLPPPSKRWRISYDQTLEGFEVAARELVTGHRRGIP